MKVLIIEDEKRLANALKFILKENNFEIDIANDGNTGYDLATFKQYNVIILDIMLPGMNGFEILKSLRKNGYNTPILMLTAKDSTMSKIEGLNFGADDYMTKPFDSDELVARINALTRRNGVVIMDSISFGDLTLNTTSGELSCNEDSVKLNFKEKEIIKIFLTSPQVVVSKDILLDRVWGLETDASDNNIEAYISFLRKKLKFLESKVIIKNYQKFGYKLEISE